MANDVTLMVLPSAAADGRPRFLLEVNRTWRDYGTSTDGLGMSGLQAEIEGSLDSSMQYIAGGFAPPANWNPLANVYNQLHDGLWPEKLREVLWAASEGAQGGDPPVLSLHVDDGVEWIPWEVMPLHDSMLGLCFQVARLPIVKSGPDLSLKQPHKVQRVYSLLGRKVLEDDQGLYDEWAGMFADMLNANIVRYPTAQNGHNVPPAADAAWPTQKKLEEAQTADILHITCHGGLRKVKAAQAGIAPEMPVRTGAPFWTLNLATVGVEWLQILPGSISQLSLTSRPLVFGNACQSTGAANINSSPGNLISGFGPTFFSRGAIAFIGTVAPINRVVALRFALTFYDKLLNSAPRLSVAKALWATKKHFQDAGTLDPTYLFYCLYGPPDTEFIRA